MRAELNKGVEYIDNDANDFDKLKNKNGEDRACITLIKLYLTLRRLWNRYGPLSFKIT